MNLLPLDDSRWRELCHRGWSNGQRFNLASDAPFVPDILRKLVAEPSRVDLFTDLSPWLCSEGSAWSAAYATVPYAVDFARRVPPANRLRYLFFVGFVAQDSCPESGTSFEIKPYLIDDFKEGLSLALPLLAETLSLEHDQTTTRYILSTIAALKGHKKLADVLEHIDCICGECQRCGECVDPNELQDIA